MVKSSTPPLLVVALAWAGAASAQPSDAEALVTAQRQQVQGVVRPRCRPSDDPDEIIVCGRGDDRGPRGPLPALPFAPEPGTIPAADRAGGEQRAAMANNRCIRLCPQPVSIDIIRTLRSVEAAVGRLLDDE